ncbi:MAG TPA: Fe-S cluster assembly protein SufB, partial [Acholeplasmataceae bacterium]|nr:Fe-S cluster assembly protein SufB [Acholeplasmataceae bacterium]
MDDNKKKIDSIVGEYQFGWHTDSKLVFTTGKGLNEEVVRTISKYKNEPEWMLEFRLKSYKKFTELKNPTWGPDL